MRDQDRFLPIANVSRLMKKTLPEGAKIAKDAKETVQECVSEFISFITSEYPFIRLYVYSRCQILASCSLTSITASDRCQQEKRKTINGEDILWAMQTLGFDNYLEPLRIYLQKYRDSLKDDKDGTKKADEEHVEAGLDMYNQQSYQQVCLVITIIRRRWI